MSIKEVKTLLEKSRPGVSGALITDHDFAAPKVEHYFDPSQLRTSPVGLPELTESEIVRHFTALSRLSHGVDNGAYPLGSCTMKYNPKRNDLLAGLSGFRDAHPHQPPETLTGLWELYFHLQRHLCEITGMSSASLVPAAGAHGELAGLLMLRAHFKHINQHRPILLITDSAHGTNASSAAMAGFQCRLVPTDANGLLDTQALDTMLDDSVAGLMMTNPSTLGLFDENILEISAKVHACGGLLYYDGANLNALMGIARPGDMGFDVIHVNTHKTFSTPHGGGGPGAGPVAVNRLLEPYLPGPVIVRSGNTFMPDRDRPLSIGRIKSHHGHVAVLVRAYAYILTLGAQGLRQVSENAVLNANYLQARLADLFPPVFNRPCMHETLLSGSRLTTETLDFARQLIDHDVHPPTMLGAGCVYFPGDLKSAMLIEPTETESLDSLDAMIEVFRAVFHECSDGSTKT